MSCLHSMVHIWERKLSFFFFFRSLDYCKMHFQRCRCWQGNGCSTRLQVRKTGNITPKALHCQFLHVKKKQLSRSKCLVSSCGQGKRKLVMIPSDSNGYTRTQIWSVTGSGKSTLYIVPLQHHFDLTPLPPDAIELQSMPKAWCQTCKVSFPLQILALHVKEFMESSAEDTEVSVALKS